MWCLNKIIRKNCSGYLLWHFIAGGGGWRVYNIFAPLAWIGGESLILPSPSPPPSHTHWPEAMGVPFPKSSNIVSVVLTILQLGGKNTWTGTGKGWWKGGGVNSCELQSRQKLGRRCNPRTLVSVVLCSTFSLCFVQKSSIAKDLLWWAKSAHVPTLAHIL